MRPLACFFVLSLSATFQLPAQPNYPDLSKQIMQSLRDDKPVAADLEILAQADPGELAKQLDSEAKKKAFWINVYNAQILVILNQNPEMFDERPGFFKKDLFTVAGRRMSFEFVEHGILRRSKNPLGLGVLPKLFPGSFERKMRVAEVDPRIHFALNCGAKSCPPLAAYDYRTLDADLDTMSRNYLQANSRYDAAENTLYVPKLLSWFSGDFGLSDRKKRHFLEPYGVIPERADNPDIAYLEYDWTLQLNNFTDWLE